MPFSASLGDLRAQVRALEDEHRANGVPLSGRIIHVCHYLPITSTLTSRSGVLSPPSTPPSETPPSTSQPAWTLGPRYGHSAMVSGIRSLSATHEQILIGWTGDILSPMPGETISESSISQEDREALEDALTQYQSKEDEDSKTLYVPVWLNDKVAHGHYDGYCKTILWPLFHYLLWQDVATEYSSADHNYPFYEAANASFARRIADVYQPGDLVWVHDYHLLLVPKLVRELIPDAVLGLFVHTPFPSSEVFRCLPRRKEILDGILGADLVCFQTYSYTRHFISTCVRVCGYESNPRGIDVEGHITSVGHCAVGIDAERVSKDTLRPGIQPKLEALRTLYEGKKIIVGRDKLDVVKGVLQKLRAFEKLLQDCPEWIGKVVMIQVTSPALSDSPKLERQISELVAHINGEFGSLDFIPVHHYHQTLKKDEFYALLSVADLALITPLRDGMNTTSMEFVIAQERTKKSPSVVSEFMGISQTMSDALQVNPWNLGDVASAINKALTMPETERKERHDKLYKVVTTHTSHSWAAILVKMLLGQMNGQNTAKQTPYIPREFLKEKYHHAKKRLFLFDYDGTLSPIVRTPSMAIPSEEALSALAKLTSDPANLVYIISGRDGDFLHQHLGHIRKLGFSAEHGGFVRERGSEEWANLTEKLDMSWMSEVEEIFKYYTERTTGSHIEVKKSSITWHYRGADPEWGLFQSRQCQDLLENNIVPKRPIELLVGKKNLEVRPVAVNKGEIVKRILYQNPDADFIFCAGDDKTDEDMFRVLQLFPHLSSSGALLNSTSTLNQTHHITLDPPVSVTLIEPDREFKPVDLHIKPDAIFTTAVGHSSKRTLASWHVTTPQEVVELMLDLVGAKPHSYVVHPNGDAGGKL